jgi:Leucine-rich repeat (LRR) protein
LTKLRGLLMSNNHLTGSIPNELSSLAELTSLYLQGNQLSGCFPESLQTFCNINYNFTNNPGLPWNGDFTFFCNDEEQIGVACDDGNPNTEHDVITTDCKCLGQPIVVTQCRLRDSLALVAFYNATGGPYWINSWDLTQPLGVWHGVTLNAEGCVICLDLDGNSNCAIDYAGGNQLTGTIPSELGNLLNLTGLYLNDNQLTGPIPVELGRLVNLNQLSIESNLLNGPIPIELGNLVNLNQLLLGANQLTGLVPPELGNLANLTSLHLQGNQLSGCFPESLQTFCNNDYNFADNLALPWKGDFSYFCNGEEQIGADCDNRNPSTEYDVIMADCECLGQPIVVTECRLQDSLALAAFYHAAGGPNWTNTWDLEQSIDTWYGVSLNEEGCVTCLDLDGDPDCAADFHTTGNNLTGIIPPELGSLNELRFLSLFSNQISGSIPPELGNLINLTILNLEHNQIEGSIPAELGGLINLDLLNLRDNELDGSIPATLGNLIELRSLFLGSNQLNGSIPSEIGNLIGLRILDLSRNQLENSIPAELGNLVSLENLNLYDNRLEGAIPPELGNLRALDFLFLQENRLSGSIPVELANLTNLRLLDLSVNQLNGSIPPVLSNLLNLGTLSLHSNQLTGGIPPELSNLSNLYELELSGNQLTGEIPSELSNLSNLVLLGLYANQLSGSIPPEIGELTNLRQLALGENQLSGAIPPELGNLVNLGWLNLHGNQLSGNIPAEIGSLTRLRGLFLSENQLSGNIPIELNHLARLSHLSLYSNQLSGCFPEGMQTFCALGFSTDLYLDGYNFTNNPALPWQGDFARFCNDEPQIGAPCDDGNPDTQNDVIQPDCRCSGTQSLPVAPVVLLQGPYDEATGLLQDHLRADNLLPPTEPYTALSYPHLGGGGETVQPSVFETTGPDAIVDWLFLELRDKNDPATVRATRSALLQADGDVVDTDGLSPVAFADLPPDDYYLVVKHRNHLGVMTAAPVALSGAPAAVDFTTDLNQVAGGANGVTVLPDGKLGLFSGDFNGNGQVQNTDYAGMVLTLGTAGYLPGDFDLNGQVQNTDLQFQLLPNIGRGAGVPFE